MNAAKVYKINVRNNVLRQVVFTDFNIFIGLIILSAIITWQCLVDSSIELKVFISLILSGLLMLFFTTKIDRQSLFVIAKRASRYIFRNRKIRC